MAPKQTSRQPAQSLMPLNAALLMVFLVFLGMIIETIVSLNGLMFAAYYLTNTGSVVLIPYWPWNYIFLSDLWSLWVIPALFFLLWPLIWGFLVVGLSKTRDFRIPLYVQFGSIILDVLIIADAEFRTEFGVNSVIPAYTFLVLILSVIQSLLIYGLVLGALYAFLFRLIIRVTGLEGKLNLKTYFMRAHHTVTASKLGVGKEFWIRRRAYFHVVLIAIVILVVGLWFFQPVKFETQSLITTLVGIVLALGADLSGLQGMLVRRSDDGQ